MTLNTKLITVGTTAAEMNSVTPLQRISLSCWRAGHHDYAEDDVYDGHASSVMGIQGAMTIIAPPPSSAISESDAQQRGHAAVEEADEVHAAAARP